jgi:hypothetical protein
MLANLLYFIVLLQSGLVGWTDLSGVSYKWTYSAELGQKVELPIFGTKVQQLEGKEIVLSGYYLPIDMDDPYTIVISKNPYASCFFCGSDSGPESVAEIKFAQRPPRFGVDQVVRIKGKLKLNATDYDHMIFILLDAQLY